MRRYLASVPEIIEFRPFFAITMANDTILPINLKRTCYFNPVNAILASEKVTKEQPADR